MIYVSIQRLLKINKGGDVLNKDQVELFVKIMKNIQEQFDLQDKRIDMLIEKQNEINNRLDENIMILRDALIKFTRPL